MAYTGNYTVIDRELLEMSLTYEYIESSKIPLADEDIQVYADWLQEQNDQDIVLLWQSLTDTDNFAIYACEDLNEAKVSNISGGFRCVICGESFTEKDSIAITHAKEHKDFLEMWELHPMEVFAPIFLTKQSMYLSLFNIEDPDFEVDYKDDVNSIYCPVPLER